MLKIISVIFMTLAFSASLQAAEKSKLYIPNDDDIQLVEKLYKSQEFSKAIDVYEKLAKAGDSYSQYKLSIMLLLGQGTDQNDIKAYAWAFLAKSSKQKSFVDYFNQLDESIEQANRDEFENAAFELYEKYNDLAVSNRFLKHLKEEFPKCTGSRLRSISACNKVRVMCDGYFGEGKDKRYLLTRESCKDFLVKIHPDNLKALKTSIDKMQDRIDMLKQRKGRVTVSEDT